ncbi:hypothetical protein V502_01947 [Pseudogymnoascus sp. VKM F-4520 (FW-2644)]|nr:hypothetical protein V502_01947 [Pseudogymnoascus sp. VKM F-4520 (FW-2644)]
MAEVPLSFACGLYDRVNALYTGEVKATGIDLDFVVVNHPRILFDNQSKAGGPAYDSSELSASEYITRYAAGDRTWVAIPVFPSRLFRHGFIVVNTNKIKTPRDLNGAKFGVQLYTMTAAVWIRGLLEEELGADTSSIDWIEGSLSSAMSYGKASVLPGVSIVTNTSGKTLDELLVEGSIDAVIGAETPPSLGKVAHIQRLFPDVKKEEKQYYLKHGIFPIMHLVVIRRDIWEKNKHVAKNLFNALNESKNIALERMRFLSALRYMLPWLPTELEEIREVFGDDFWPYGLEENRKTLETLVRYLFKQGMIKQKLSLDELFVPV